MDNGQEQKIYFRAAFLSCLTKQRKTVVFFYILRFRRNEMKRVRIATILAALLIAAALLAGCKKEGKAKDGVLKIVLLITSQLGDRGFYDSANDGMALLKNELGAEVKTIEMGQDPSKYEPYIRDVAEQDWDYIVIGSSPAIQIAEELIPQYPKKKFIMFDTEVDWAKADFSNLYCVTYKQNEGSFLAGVTAAIMTTEGKKANPQKIIGAIAGAEHPIISDFLIGYIEGARAVDSGIKVAIAYAGTFIDSTKGKELGMAMMGQQKVDICFQVVDFTPIGAHN
jgi:basic membrane protein A